MSSGRDDAGLVAACLSGDTRAWSELVDRYGPLVWAIAKGASLSSDDQADVFQNSWIVAVEDLPRLREPAAFAGWIRQIARHQSLRIRRGYGLSLIHI